MVTAEIKVLKLQRRVEGKMRFLGMENACREDNQVKSGVFSDRNTRKFVLNYR